MNVTKLNVPLSVKSLASREFEGHGAIFKNVDLGGDIIVPGAFTKSLKQHASDGSLPIMLWMHDPSRVPGKWLEMGEDANGLVVKGVLADTDLGNEVHTLLKMEAVRGMSIGYKTRDSDYDRNGNRLLKTLDIYEVSIVSMPMNPRAQIAHVKSRLSAEGVYVPTPREWEHEMDRLGCTKSGQREIIKLIYGTSESGGTLDEEGPKEEAGGTLAESEAKEDAAAIAALEELNNALIADRLKKIRFR